MNPKFRRVVESILSAEDALPAAPHYDELIPAYIEAELRGENVAAVYPELTAHLHQCSDCFEQYADLKALLELEQQGGLPVVEPPKRFDLAFLRNDAPSLWTVTERNMRRLATTITAKLGNQVVSLTNLAEQLLEHRQLIASPIPARAAQRPGLTQADVREVLALPDQENDIRIRLFMGPVQKGCGVIQVRVEDLAFQGLPQVRVTLRDQNQHLLVRLPTDQDGFVIFQNLTAGDYFIQIRQEQSEWSIPLVLEAGS